MNKIYKLIWNKVRNCYVAVSEFAKGHGKSCTSVNCGGKAKGSCWLRMAAVILGVTAAICAVPAGAMANSGGQPDGDNYIGSASEYKVTIYGTVNGNVYGRYENSAVEISGATVSIISGGTVSESVIGGYSNNTGTATHNTVSISGGTVGDGEDNTGHCGGLDAVVGGYSSKGNVTYNKVIITGGTIMGGIFGGSSYMDDAEDQPFGNVENNEVEITDGTVGTVSRMVGVSGGQSYYTEANYNTVSIGSTAEVYLSNLFGGFSRMKDVTGNTVTLSSGASSCDLVFGGVTDNGDKANENEVTVTAGTVAQVKGGQSSSGAANGNKVTIGGTAKILHNDDFSNEVYGGSGWTEASNNTVTIQENAVLDSTTSIYGGLAEKYDNGTSVLGVACNNTVNIFKPIAVKHIAGGTGTTSEGNTLNLGAAGITVGDEGVTDFQTIALTKNVAWTDGTAVLSATKFLNAGGTNFSGALDISEATGLSSAANLGTMKLLASETKDNFQTLSLTYSGGTEDLHWDNPSVTVMTVTDAKEFTPAKGLSILASSLTHTVSLDQDNEYKNVLYNVSAAVSEINLGNVDWKKDAVLFDGSSTTGYDYTAVKALGTDGFAVSYESPETVAAGDSMTLLQANATLKDMAEQVKKTSYSYTPVEGVTVDANITGKLAASGGAVTYTAAENQASKLTFTNVDWKDSGALLTRPSNITFAGADVDTTKIHFKNVKELDANKKMTLVSDFGNSVGTITGTKYTVGAGLEGEGAASLSGSDLIFTTKTGVKDLAAQEQTHNTLMVMEAGMAVLAAGNEHVGQALAELGNTQNAAVDGTVTAASLGGSKSRYKTGSHVDSDSWNVAVAVGSKRELKKGSLEWGVFGEYGKSNYTLHSDAGRGDGDSHYAGGGLMAKWTNKHDVYTEASVRLGRLSDTASNLLRDATGNGYGYDVHANYFGTHVGIGKIINYKGGKSLDVYGKYFYTKRDGVDFTSGGNNYSLDSVASSILRVGARYGTTDKKWNWYGGLAYEYEFDGKSEGTVDGVGIRAASVKGGSVRGEIGLRMSATKTNPWQTDISIYGYGGKHRGFGGSVNVAYMF